ncbi:Efflux pump dotC [Cladobotryum mycophilum]|uniref:Efflux pump dotC n=1 Tax=Cladobotryum mycophilum TaxID=491253 RepID=A0ABR0T569_9HYPO
MSSGGDTKTLDHSTESDLEKQTSPDGVLASDSAQPDAPIGKRPPGAKAGLTVTQFWLCLFGLNIGMMLTALDFNIVATAVPIISSEFKEYNNAAWLGSGFLITFAIVLPITAKLGDVFGRKNMFLFFTVIFALGSALCGWSKSMKMLIGSRIVQGLGAGGIYGLVNVILTDLVDLQDVGKYLSLTAAIWAIADVAGPLLGGVFSQYATWRWCFWLNLIIAPISFIIVVFVLKLPRGPKVSVSTVLASYDYIGTLLMSGGTAALVLGLSWGGNAFEWHDSRVIGTLVGGFAMLVVFFVWENFAKDPLIFPSMIKSRTILAIVGAEFMYGMSLLGCMYYVPQFFQLVFGDSATLAGVGLLPMMLGLGIGNPAAAWVTSKYGVTLINAIVGACLEILATGLMTRWDASTGRAEAVILLIILGIGQGAVMSALLLSAQVAVVPAQIGIVTGLVIFIQTVGDIFGITIFATLYVNKLSSLLQHVGLTTEQISTVLTDVQNIRSQFDAETVPKIVEVYAKSLQNGWWLMFATTLALLLFTCLSRQHKFGENK